MSESSLLAQIKQRKSCLKSQETVITSSTGVIYLEKKTDDGQKITTKISKATFGFVVDDKPDIQVAEILPYLLLSSQDVAQDPNLLKNNNVTHVLSIGVEIVPDNFVPNITYKKISLLDVPDADLLGILNASFDFISNALMKNEKSRILVHCNAGFSRSPSVVIAYLMKTFKYTLEYSLNLVKEKRNVHPNNGFMRQLKQYEKQLTETIPGNLQP